jgi:hypothetical protein
VYPQSDLVKYELNVPHSLLRFTREGEVAVVAGPVASGDSKNLTGLLISDWLFLYSTEKYSRLLSKSELRVKLLHCLPLASLNFDRVGLAKGVAEELELVLVSDDSVTWRLRFPTQTARDGWWEDLQMCVERGEASRDRARKARKSVERQKRSSTLVTTTSSPVAPSPPTPVRRAGVLMGLIDELRTVQVLKGKDAGLV